MAVIADGDVVDVRQWPITTEPGRPRPTIEISLITDEGMVKTIVLPGHAIAPYEVEAGEERAELRSPVDLDGAGRHREDW